MPPRQRAAVSYNGNGGASSGSESESDAPRAARPIKKGKGRVVRSPSPVYHDSDGSSPPRPKKAAPPRVASTSSDDDAPAVARTPLKSMSLNDQRRLSMDISGSAKAKRRLSGRPNDLRRQSLSNSVNRAGSPLVAGLANGKTSAVGKGQPPKVAALAATAARRQARHSGAGLVGQLGGEGPLAPVSQEVMANNYEEWMKMATDNKINATNTWNFALIDYFHDMSLLRNTDSDNSINFQKASCTLDGCVKIWTSRVDSVATETGKLLSGLAEDGAIMQGQEEDDEQAEGSDVETQQRARQRKAGRKADTLVDFEKIAAKKLDLEVSVDPLFKKTAADFDEGGAGGILMNHLGLDSSMRVIFDAGDARLEDGGIEAGDGTDEDQVDLSQLRATFLPDLEMIDTMVICPSLSSFKFSSDPNAIDLSLFRNVLGASVLRHSANASAPHPLGDGDDRVTPLGESNADFFATQGGDDDQVFQDFGGGGDDYDGDEHAGGADFFADEAEPLDPRRPPAERDLVMAFTKDGDGQMFDYFDSALAKNWAGPQHWKMSRTIRRVAAEEDAAAGKGKRTVKEKVPFSIDFSTPATVSSKELFEPGTKTATMLPKSKRKVTDNHMLPDDMHFNSSQLLRLFLKPKAMINMRRRGLRFAPAASTSGGGEEVDEHYWAEANAAAAEGDDTAGLDDSTGMPMPFATQFFNDDGDFGPDYDDDLAMGDDAGELAGVGPSSLDGVAAVGEAGLPDTEAELLAAMQSQAKRVRPEHVNYAKKAKRVDVRKLKENIWRELRLEAEPPTPSPEDTATPAPAVEPKTFTTVLSGLRKAYPTDRMDEISTSFCFICLLHLANEQNLRIGNIRASAKLQTLGALREGDVDEDALYVGDLSALRITKEQARVVLDEGDSD